MLKHDPEPIVSRSSTGLHHYPLTMTEEAQKQQDRIYIGGLDPPHLKPSDVVKRLESLSSIQILEKDFDNDKNFFHINASVVGDKGSALEIVTKTYNNVKWKGCRLTVKAAQPHFLDRLLEEHRQRDAPKEIIVVAEEAPDEPPKPPRRRLRIRQKYGTEAHRVDTKPCETEDWKSFDKICSEMRKRRERKPNLNKKTKKAAAAKALAFYSRAVHLTFNYDGNGAMMTEEEKPVVLLPKTQTANGDKVVVKEEDSAAAVHDDDDDDDDSSSPEDEETTMRQETKPKAYDWSSDDDSSDDESDDDDSKVQTTVSSEQIVASTTDDKDDGSDPAAALDSDADADDIIVTGNTTTTTTTPQQQQQETAKPYDWSSDESDDEPTVSPPFKVQKTQPEVSEFASAIDFDDDDDDEGPYEGTTTVDHHDTTTDANDLQQDVEMNMGVLSQLFPDFKDATPKQVGKPEEVVKVGWKASSMQRYDPTKESSQQYELEIEEPIIEEEEAVVDDDDDAMDDDDAKVNDDNKGAENNNDQIEPDTSTAEGNKVAEGNVYHESQLEEVFRKARDSGEGGGFQVSSMFGEQPDELKEKEKTKEEATGSFSFNFEVVGGAPAAEEVKKTEDGFSFGFDVEASAAPTNVAAATDEPTKEDEPNVDEAMTDSTPTATKKRRRGLLPPDSVVDHLYNKFFELNEGLAIQNDPDGFRTDEVVRASWHKERYTLTQDWKRKKKYAQSRLQKNNKFRK